VNESGAKWELEQFQFDLSYDPIPGWALSTGWLRTEDGLPSRGILFVKFVSSRGVCFVLLLSAFMFRVIIVI
jgi:hypothetical protein